MTFTEWLLKPITNQLNRIDHKLDSVISRPVCV